MTVSDATAPTGLRRWGGYIALVIVFSIACGFLSWWQWSRQAQTQAEAHLIAANFASRPVGLPELLPHSTSWRHTDEWRTVKFHGRYLNRDQLLVRNRVYNGNPGFEVVVPFELDDGSIFLVDRGWLPIGTDHDVPDVVPAAPVGEVTVTAHLQQTEPVLPGRTAPKGQVPEINVAEILSATGHAASTFTGAYGTVATEDPAPPSSPQTAQEPVVDPGPYLSYAIQWIAFAILAFFGLFWAVRRERKLAAMAAKPMATVPAPRVRPSDSDVEDAILDEAGIR